MNLLRRFQKRHRVAAGIVDVAPGETATFGAMINPDVLDRAVFVARWECGGCDRLLRKSMPARAASEYGFSIACPYCDPDNIFSRTVEEDRP